MGLTEAGLDRIRAIVFEGKRFDDGKQPLDRKRVQLWLDEVQDLVAGLQEARASEQVARSLAADVASENERLREALAPFAKLEEAYRDNEWPDHVEVFERGDWSEYHVITMGQLRAVRAALEGPK